MTSPAPLDPGLERQPGEPLGGYVARLEDTYHNYLTSAQQLAARLAQIEAACAGEAASPPAPLVLHTPSGALAGQEGAPAPDPASQSPYAFRPPREATVIAQLERWVAGSMARDRVYLVGEIAEATGINEASVKAYVRRLWRRNLLGRAAGRAGSHVYFHPGYVAARDLRAEVLAHLRGLSEEQQDNAAAVAQALGGDLSADDVRPVLEALAAEGVAEGHLGETEGEPDVYYWLAEVAA
ncbi:hypothetical protein [Deinococcus petrolearius]|uniref:Uncharacterized protein n=1 Tax=Deinococcus petrolearius TaxID=1751295 RepID=A0ABW1DDF6_9DEIO